jgi:hypothetical protein
LARDCFVAQGAPRNDSANLIGIFFSVGWPSLPRCGGDLLWRLDGAVALAVLDL